MPKSVSDYALQGLVGNYKVLIGANPAAGAEFTQTVLVLQLLIDVHLCLLMMELIT